MFPSSSFQQVYKFFNVDKMAGFGKKRRADPDSEPEDVQAPVASKKSKSNAAAAPPTGKDDEGHPFWEVLLLTAYTQ